ncbi:MAG: cadherin-like domain-containing protein [Gemmataceae bacterium]|nr:cadherin-like domain-containing protein [Gemmataceae bacterium]
MEHLEDRLAPAVGFPGTETVTALLTADNHYGLYRGSADASSLSLIGRNEVGFNGNPGPYNWSLPETYTFQASPGDYLYVLAWDDGGPQAWIGQFDLNGVPLYSDISHWQYTVSAGANPGENGDVPALSAVAATIASATWANPGASAANGSSPWGTIPGLSANAQFVWHDTLGADSTSDGHYVIYRTAAPVVPANHPPAAGDDSAATTKNVPLDIAAATLLANDTDADGETLRVISVTTTSSQGGTASLNANGTPANFADDFVEYDPPTGFFGTDTFQYTIQDSFGWTATATVTVTVTSPDAITATLTADNHYGLYFGSADGSSLTFVGRNEVGAAGNPGTYNWSEPETFDFEPGVGNYIYVVVWDDGSEQMWVGEFDLPGGSALLSDANNWQYTVASGPNPGETGPVPALSDLMTTISGAAWAAPQASAPMGIAPWTAIPGMSTAAQFVWPDRLDVQSASDAHYVIFRTVAPVNPANHRPVAESDEAFTNEHHSVTIATSSLLANDHDLDGNALRVVSITTTTAGGTASLNDNGTPLDPTDDFIDYAPPVGFVGTDTFDYTIRDSLSWGDVATVYVTVSSLENDITATLTADNHYGLYFGSTDGTTLTFVGRNEVGLAGNPGESNWSLPESFEFEANVDDRLYVLVWDDGGPQMWTGQFTLGNGETLISDTTHWEYTVAQGSNPGQDGDVPPLSDVMTVIANATWAAPLATAPDGTAPWGSIPGISTDANFVWHDTFASTSSSDGHFVIFRTVSPAVTDAPPVITVLRGANAVEGNDGLTSVEVTVVLSGATTQTVTVDYSTAEDTATADDYVATSGTLVFEPGRTIQTFFLNIVGDTTSEDTEFVRILLSNPVVGILGGGNQDAVAILNDDAPTLTIEAVDPAASEAGSDGGTFLITRTGNTDEDLFVHFQVDGSATPGTDYLDLLDNVFMPAGASTITLSVTPVDDYLAEGNETVIVTLLPGFYNAVGAASQATVTIADDATDTTPVVSIVATDPNAGEVGPDPGIFTITRTGDTSADLVVHYQIAGSGTAGVDYATLAGTVVIPAGSQSVTITINPFDDNEVEGYETVVLTLENSAEYAAGPSFFAGVAIEDKQKKDAPNVKEVHPLDSDFAAGMQGRILIANRADNIYDTVAKTTSRNTAAQTQTGQVTVSAYLDQLMAGVTVYFEVLDPDDPARFNNLTGKFDSDWEDSNPRTTYDFAKEDDHGIEKPGPNSAPFDNRSPSRGMYGMTVEEYGKMQRNTLSATSAITQLKMINGVMQAVAEVQLFTTNVYSGDNYLVRATTVNPNGKLFSDDWLRENKQPGFPDAGIPAENIARSAVLTAWWRTYYEQDSMYRVSSAIKVSASAGQKNVTVEDGNVFKAGDKVRLIDLNYQQGERRTIASISGNVLTLDQNLAKTYAADKGGFVGKETDTGLALSVDAVKGQNKITVPNDSIFKKNMVVQISDSLNSEPNPLTITNIDGNVLTLSGKLQNDYTVARLAFVRSLSEDYFIADTSKLAETFDDTFVEVVRLPQESGWIEKSEFFAGSSYKNLADSGFGKSVYYKSTQGKLTPRWDVFYLVGAGKSPGGNSNYAGVTDDKRNISIIFMADAFGDYGPVSNRDSTNHEIVHQFLDPNDRRSIITGERGHNTLPAHDGSGDGCLMNARKGVGGKSHNPTLDRYELSLDMIYSIRDRYVSI